MRRAARHRRSDQCGLTDAGLTDARTEPRVEVLATFADKTHAPILYPAARTSATADPKTADSFLAFLRGKQAVTIIRHAGFIADR